MKILLFCALVGLVAAQRGSYGGNRPITGSRYAAENTAAPAQSNFVAPSQGAAPVAQNQGSDNRFSGNNGGSNYQQQQPNNHQHQPYNQQSHHQQQPGGFGGFGTGFPNNQGFQPFPFNGR